jgi:hypothetical protein
MRRHCSQTERTTTHNERRHSHQQIGDPLVESEDRTYSDSDGEILCLSCPPGDKPVAEYQLHSRSVGVYPACVECAKDDLVDADELPDWKRDNEPVAGHLTPINGGPKIRT